MKSNRTLPKIEPLEQRFAPALVTPVYALSQLNGNTGFKISGAEDVDFTGASVCGVGDINGDGIDDMAVAAPLANAGGNTRVVSQLMFSEYILPFELTSVLLLGSIVGAVAIAKRKPPAGAVAAYGTSAHVRNQ